MSDHEMAESGATPPPPGNICRNLHHHVSSFVDAFVDFSVAGIFFRQDAANPHTATSAIQTRYPAPGRLVAVGDLHGDFTKSLRALALAGLVDLQSHRWIAGATTAVQVGDVLDRGADEIRLIYLLHRLKQDAAAQGGALLTMLGNHEIMNVESDFRFVHRFALAEFQAWARWYQTGSQMKSICPNLNPQPDIFAGIPARLPGVREEFQEGFRARIAALRPGGPISKRFLADNPTVLVVGDSVFVHGGLLREHAAYGLERMNEEVRAWIGGATGRRRGPGFVRGRDSVVWLRRFSEEAEGRCDCAALASALAAVPGARRMVMGHTIQREGINGVCENRAIRIDVGLSKGCGNGLPEVLEINGDSSEITVLTSNPMYRNRTTSKETVGLGLLLPESRIATSVEVNA